MNHQYVPYVPPTFTSILRLFDINVLTNPRMRQIIENKLNEYSAANLVTVNEIRCQEVWELRDDRIYMFLRNYRTREQVGHLTLHYSNLPSASHIRSDWGLENRDSTGRPVNRDSTGQPTNRPSRNILLTENYLSRINVTFTPGAFHIEERNVQGEPRRMPRNIILNEQNLNDQIHINTLEAARRVTEAGLTRFVDITRTAINNLQRDARAEARIVPIIQDKATAITNILQNIQNIYDRCTRLEQDAISKVNNNIPSKQQYDSLPERLRNTIDEAHTVGINVLPQIDAQINILLTALESARLLRNYVNIMETSTAGRITEIDRINTDIPTKQSMILEIQRKHDIRLTRRVDSIRLLEQTAIDAEQEINRLSNIVTSQMDRVSETRATLTAQEKRSKTVTERRQKRKEEEELKRQENNQSSEEPTKKQKTGGGYEDGYKNITIKNIPTENFLVNLLASNAYITIYKLYMNTFKSFGSVEPFETFETYNIDFKELQNNPRDDLFSILLPELLNFAKKYVSEKMGKYEKEIMDEIKNKKHLHISTIDYLSYVSKPKYMESNISPDNDQQIDFYTKYLKYKYKYLEIKKYK